MKQRLGIAQALLGNQELLLLDEPTNGLDPAGIHEMRNLIRDLPERNGVTVFLSSHLLSEVGQVATHFAIITKGRLKFEGTPEQLRILSEQLIVVQVDLPGRAESQLTEIGCAVTRDGSRLVVVANRPSELNRILVEAGIAVSHLSMQHKTLEDIFSISPSQLLRWSSWANDAAAGSADRTV